MGRVEPGCELTGPFPLELALLVPGGPGVAKAATTAAAMPAIMVGAATAAATRGPSGAALAPVNGDV